MLFRSLGAVKGEISSLKEAAKILKADHDSLLVLINPPPAAPPPAAPPPATLPHTTPPPTTSPTATSPTAIAVDGDKIVALLVHVQDDAGKFTLLAAAPHAHAALRMSTRLAEHASELNNELLRWHTRRQTDRIKIGDLLAGADAFYRLAENRKTAIKGITTIATDFDAIRRDLAANNRDVLATALQTAAQHYTSAARSAVQAMQSMPEQYKDQASWASSEVLTQAGYYEKFASDLQKDSSDENIADKSSAFLRDHEDSPRSLLNLLANEWRNEASAWTNLNADLKKEFPEGPTNLLTALDDLAVATTTLSSHYSNEFEQGNTAIPESLPGRLDVIQRDELSLNGAVMALNNASTEEDKSRSAFTKLGLALCRELEDGTAEIRAFAIHGNAPELQPDRKSVV